VGTYDDLVELARIMMRRSRAVTDKTAAAALQRMAKEYQRRAADADGGKLPDIGENEMR
jgi:hypothetical protein